MDTPAEAGKCDCSVHKEGKGPTQQPFNMHQGYGHDFNASPPTPVRPRSLRTPFTSSSKSTPSAVCSPESRSALRHADIAASRGIKNRYIGAAETSFDPRYRGCFGPRLSLQNRPTEPSPGPDDVVPCRPAFRQALPLFNAATRAVERSNWVFAPARWFHNWSSQFHLDQIWADRVDGVLSHSGRLYFSSVKGGVDLRAGCRLSSAGPPLLPAEERRPKLSAMAELRAQPVMAASSRSFWRTERRLPVPVRENPLMPRSIL